MKVFESSLSSIKDTLLSNIMLVQDIFFIAEFRQVNFIIELDALSLYLMNVDSVLVLVDYSMEQFNNNSFHIACCEHIL